jgi:hypothetical protein
MKMNRNVDDWCNDTEWGKGKYPEKNLSHRQFDHRKSHTTDPGTKTILRSVPATQVGFKLFTGHERP